MQVDAQPSNATARDAAMADLIAAFGAERIVTGRDIRNRHGTDESYHPTMAPDAVFFARSTEEVSQVVTICAKHKWPVIPFGVGTSLEGGIAAMRGGLSVDVSEMNKILQVNAEDLDVRVQAGVTRKQLNEHLRDTGLMFPIDPGADASIGGMCATRASGTNAVRYGTMRDNVMSLTVVMADGRIVKTARRAKKSAAGYDLTRLFVGSEGTLGVITEVQLKVYGIPEAISSAVVQFDDLESAVNTCVLTIQSGVPVARMELLDDTQMGACISYSKLEGYTARPTLFFEFHGSENGVVEQAETVQAIAADFGGTDFKWATKPEDRNKLWEARHNAFYAALSLRPGAKGWPTDVCVPISRLAECITETKKDLAETGLLAPLVGHVGDGNFHLVYVIDPESQAELDLAKAHSDRMVLRALSMDGTCTGEHGVGYGKMEFLAAELPEAIPVMRAVKQALDPDNIMNPGKLFRMN
ncbi:FAD-linked oxidase C-terminal domain-containing protein [Thalassobaculum sp. OXR-137]|uniref:FAD-binding oxidoreductase n=1 Tax=Thalassobaculum sp. OXR-137 TaxID=3100173 RepID=UPI002AC9385A|nr:FAD-linked oxidase C-terminal domain-containing protein [Thalassobaculum sp. OXR-137]WPZ32180.1 FAD-linked oxidase C-terminal domain-containing protein [Thalassobaculum sp. OXR-137]